MSAERADAGFTLVELLIALVLSAIIAGVTVAAMVTSMNVVSSTTDQVGDSTDAGLISAFLFRDAEAAGATNPLTGQPDTAAGVSIDSSPAGWDGCEQTGSLVVRFSWLDRTSSSGSSNVVATYALDDTKQLTRRVCANGSPTDVILGHGVSSATATCDPDPGCSMALARTVSLSVAGSGARAPLAYTLTASLRPDSQVVPTAVNSAPVPLLALGDPSTPCPSLTLGGTGTITVLGDAVVSAACGNSPISGDQSTLVPSGTVSVLSTVADPFSELQPPPADCSNGSQPGLIGASPAADSVVVYTAPVTISTAVAFAPGRYVFCAGLDLQPGADVSGSGVLFDIAGGTFAVDPGAAVDIDAATSGPYANVLLWVGTPQSVSLADGQRVDTYRGVVYAPTSSVDLAGSSAVNVGGVIARSISFGGSNASRLGLPIPRLVMSPSTLPGGEVGVAYAGVQLTSSGGTDPSSWSATNLPDGLALDAHSGVIDGTPTASGTYDVIVTTFDATHAAASSDYTVTINAELTAAAPATLPTGQIGSTYPSTTLVAEGGTAPFSWSVTGLPAGLVLDPVSGVLAGTPTDAGAASVVVTVTDAAGATAGKSYTLVVNAALGIVSPDALPAGQPGAAYPSTTFTSSGGTAPYLWSATGLPDGMQLDPGSGVLSGAPTTAGSSTVVITVGDATAATASRTYTLLVGAAVPDGCPSTVSGWRGEYYSNATLSGAPTVCRDDAAINFNWGGGSPDPAVPADHFSARWTRTQSFAAGDYTFTMGSDDGSRLYIDGTLVLDKWNDQGYPTPQPTVTRTLSAGSHTIVMEQYENGGDAAATLTWTQRVPVVCPTAPSGWLGQYYDNQTLSGSPVVCRDDAAINFNWGGGSPDASVPADHFSIRWTRTQSFAAGVYTFTMGSDDGSRLYIDGALVLDTWYDQSYPTPQPTVTQTLSAGNHTIVMEQYENGGDAAATLTWVMHPLVTCPTSPAGWTGQYYDNQTLSGSPVVCRDDAAINFNWGSGSPDPAVPTTHFSVRWSRTQSFAAGTYAFTMGSDDGGRLYIDGSLVLDRWNDQGYPTPQPTVTATLSAGTHTIVMEYYENSGVAQATLTWVMQGSVTCPASITGWKGEYFDNQTLSGVPVICRDDSAIDFSWGSGTPDPAVPADHFSARWTRTQTFAAGTYTFTMGSDDGSRLYIDGTLVLDVWHDQSYPSPQPTIAVPLTSGSHTIVMQAYENAGDAAATLTWSPS